MMSGRYTKCMDITVKLSLQLWEMVLLHRLARLDKCNHRHQQGATRYCDQRPMKLVIGKSQHQCHASKRQEKKCAQNNKYPCSYSRQSACTYCLELLVEQGSVCRYVIRNQIRTLYDGGKQGVKHGRLVVVFMIERNGAHLRMNAYPFFMIGSVQ